MILNHIIGVLNLSLPIIVAYQFFPDFIFSPYGIALCALLIGSYVFYVNYRGSKKMQKVLVYSPTGEVRQFFNDEITKCGMQPDDICLRYSYLNDNVATSTLNTICIDPMVWKGVEQDGDVIAIKNIIERHVLPAVPEQNKQLHSHIKSILMPEAQRFIFRHELGHTYHAYSYKVLISLFVIAATSTGIGMMSFAAVMPIYGGFVAVFVGTCIGGVFDMILGYTNNAFFKVWQERKADEFAVQFSTQQEIEAAADFFEKYEQEAQEFRKNNFLLAYLPVTAVTGHPKTEIRATYLRSSAKERGYSAN